MFRADVILRGKGGVMLVEVKNRQGVSTDWATQFHRNYFAHTPIPDLTIFLLVTPERMFLWSEESSAIARTHELSPPDYVASSVEILSPYLEKWSEAEGRLSHFLLQDAVVTWLTEMSFGEIRPEDLPPDVQELTGSESFQAALGGSVECDAEP